MNKLNIWYQLAENGEKHLLEIDLIDHFVSEDIFKEGHKKELESQKTFISSLIWGSIGFAINRSIEISSITCSIVFDNRHTIEVPRDVVYDIQRIIGA